MQGHTPVQNMAETTKNFAYLTPAVALAAVGGSVAALACEVLTSSSVQTKEDAAGNYLLTSLVLIVIIASPSFWDICLMLIYDAEQEKTKKGPQQGGEFSVVQLIGDSHRRKKLMELMKNTVFDAWATRVVGEEEGVQNKVSVQSNPGVATIVDVLENSRFQGFAVGFLQKSAFMVALTSTVALSAHKGGASTRLWSCVTIAAFLPAAYLVSVVSTQVNNEQLPSRTLLSTDMTLRLGVATAMYTSLRLAQHGLLHCSTALQMHCVAVDGTNTCVDACVACQASTGAVAAFAGLIGAGMAKAVLLAPIGLSPSSCIPMFQAAAVQFVCALWLLLAFAYDTSQMVELYGKGDTNVVASGSASNEMRRFLQTNTGGGLCLYTSASFFVCAIVTRLPTKQWVSKFSSQRSQNLGAKTAEIESAAEIERAETFETVYMFTRRYAAFLVTTCASVGLLISNRIFGGWDRYQDRTFLVTLCCILIFGVAGIISPNRISDKFRNPHTDTICMTIRYAAVCGVCITKSVYFFNELFRETPLASDAFGNQYMDYMQADGWNFFTNWCLLISGTFMYLHVAATLMYIISKGSVRGCLEVASSFFALIGTSVSVLLFWCAAGLLAADDGTLADIDITKTWTSMTSFLMAHFVQVVPWIMLYSLNPSEFVQCKNYCQKTMGAVWVLAGFIPFVLWLLKSTGVPSEYPSATEKTTICALLMCGLLPWATCALVVTHTGGRCHGQKQPTVLVRV
tara:strand:- start:131 stop:2350 length:2220 start_codon:yes stop_codon:yes gene_type:complete